MDIRVFSGSLFLTSEDGDGTIVVTRAACSYQAQIIVCYPTAAVLVQSGRSNALDLKTGTIYLNYTDAAQPLSGSSAKLPARSVMLALSTRNGTFVSVHGQIDQLGRTNTSAKVNIGSTRLRSTRFRSVSHRNPPRRRSRRADSGGAFGDWRTYFRMLIVRAATIAIVTSETLLWRMTSSFARGVNGIASVGLNAVEVVKAKKR